MFSVGECNLARGAPLYCEGDILCAMVTSRNNPCNESQTQMRFSKIVDHLDFIHEHMGDTGGSGHDDKFGGQTKAIVSIMDTNDKHLCLGAIISKDTILTTAKCVRNRKEAGVKVRVGDRARSVQEEKEADFGVKQLVLHPFYDPFGPLYNRTPRIVHDIAIVKLQTALTFDGFILDKYRLPKKTHTIKRYMVSYGWGSMGYLDKSKGYADFTDVAKKFDVTKEDCPESLVPSFICVSHHKEKKLNRADIDLRNDEFALCFLDMGSPLLEQSGHNQDLLIGISSNYDAYSCTQDPLVFARFTNIPQYLDFITTYM